MGVNKVEYGGRTLIDLTSDNVTADKMLTGTTAHGKNGELISGNIPNNGAVSETLDGITTKSVTIPSGFTSGGSVSLTDDIDNAVGAALAAITEKGVTVPDGTKVDGLAALIAAIEAGGGGGNDSDFPIKFSKVESGVFVLSSHKACTDYRIVLKPAKGKIKEYMGCVYAPKHESDLTTTKLFFAIQYVDNVPQMVYSTKKDILAIGLSVSVRTSGTAFTSVTGAHYDADGNAIPLSTSTNNSKYTIKMESEYVDGEYRDAVAVKNVSTPYPYYAAGCEYHWVIFYNEVD